MLKNTLLRSFPAVRTNSVRGFTTAPTLLRGRNVLAKFIRPDNIPPRTQPDVQSSTDGKDVFETTATEPVAPSLQEVPRPETSAKTKQAIAIPAMEPPAVPTIDARRVPESERSMTVAGVHIPDKPIPPGEEGKSILSTRSEGDCCMSGCVHCVYTIYADEVEEYTAALKEARSALESRKTPVAEWPSAVAELVKTAGGAEGVKKKEKEEVMKGVDPSLAAFLALENKLKRG